MVVNCLKIQNVTIGPQQICQRRGDFAAVMSHLNNLQSFTALGCRTLTSTYFLSHMPNLKKVKIASTSSVMSDISMHLDVCQQLEELYLPNNPQLEKAAVLRLVRNHCNLHALNLIATIRLEIEETLAILKNTTNLEVFACSPQFVVADKKEWETLLRKYDCLAFEGEIIDLFTNAGVNQNLLMHRFWHECSR